MLALVHPFDPAADVASHRPTAASSSSRRGPHRKQIVQRQPILPAVIPVARQTKPQTTKPPPKVVSAPSLPPSTLDIHSYPSTDLLKLLASLLTQIASTNDKLDAASMISIPEASSTSVENGTHGPVWRTLTTASRGALSTSTSTLTFHARNIPTISLEAYLLRILKYCPTTNEVFLSLLVYFDRMSKLSAEATGRSFVIDSYNIHRLVIAGVTVASKFFSDVFYTNSRYAKVGGLPQSELNQLELQFLLLNDFRLVIPKEEMQRYAEQLVLFSKSSPPADLSSFPYPAPTSSTLSSPSTLVSAPTMTMGAIDAYGGRAPGRSSSTHSKEKDAPQPPFGSVNGASSLVPSSSHHWSQRIPNGKMRQPSEDPETETETEAETETETDGWTTDDEPTIRPPHSSSSSEDSRSICGSDTGDVDEDDDGLENCSKDHEMDVEDRGDRTPDRLQRGRDGERTPEGTFERRARRADRDHRMDSP